MTARHETGAAPAESHASAGRRIGAVVLRYWYLLRGSWPRLLELIYWPTVQMLIWGLITLHLLTNSDWVAQAAGVLIAAVLLWDVLFRGQLGMSISFLEEMWSRNLGHLFVSPLRPHEWVLALMTMSLIRTLIGIVPAALLAIPLYAFNIFALGLPLVAFFALLLATGWGLALIVIAAILRYGMGAESLAWALVFLLAPISAIYYPVDVLPGFAQVIAYALPPAHVFEGMRQLLFDGTFAWDHFVAALGLVAALWAVGAGVFFAAFGHARREGSLLQQGE
jgi:ABC-2 type transport system permease protein